MGLLVFDERLEISHPVGVFNNIVECIALLEGPFEEFTEFIGIDTANVHLFAEGLAIQGRGIDVIVPHQIQIIDVFDGN
nr:hypothetical protein [Halococcoides cellulosivorans]